MIWTPRPTWRELEQPRAKSSSCCCGGQSTLTKLDSSGNITWSVQTDNTSAWNVCIGETGKLYVANQSSLTPLGKYNQSDGSLVSTSTHQTAVPGQTQSRLAFSVPDSQLYYISSTDVFTAANTSFVTQWTSTLGSSPGPQFQIRVASGKVWVMRNNGGNIALQLLNAAGTSQWTKTFVPGPDFDTDGTNSWTFDGDGLHSGRYLLSKYDGSGTLTTVGFDAAHQIGTGSIWCALDVTNSFMYAAGTFGPLPGSTALSVFKYDLTPSFQWSTSIAGIGSTIQAACLDSSGLFYVAVGRSVIQVSTAGAINWSTVLANAGGFVRDICSDGTNIYAAHTLA